MDAVEPSTTKEVELTEELMAQIDKTIEDPGRRAQRVLTLLRRNFGNTLTNWDVLCFCVEYINSIALANPIITTAAKLITKWLYMAHYVNSGFKEESKLGNS